MNHNRLTISKRQKLAKLRRQMQKAPTPAEEFVSRMRKEVREVRKNARAKRIKRGIITLLMVLMVIVLVSVW